MSATETRTAAPVIRRRVTRTGAGNRSRKSFTRTQRVVVTVLNLSLFFTLWQLMPAVLDIPTLFFPTLTAVVADLPDMHSEGILIPNVASSLRVYATGMVLAVVVSIPLGLLLGGNKVLDRILSPYLWVIYTTPLIILMPLILLWVGINDTARVLLVFISAIPAIIVVVMEGVKTVDNSLLKAARSFGADKRRLFTHVIFPSTVPFIGTGVKMGVSRGLIGLFVGELFTSDNGIGFILEEASKKFITARLYAMLLIFIIFSVSVVGLAQYVENRLSSWRTTPNL